MATLSLRHALGSWRRLAAFGAERSGNVASQCATEPGKAYTADDGDQLKQAFRGIAIKLTSLYLSK